MIRDREGLPWLITALAITVVGCSTAASVVFDVPQQPRAEPQRSMTAAPAQEEDRRADTLRPSIERTLDRDSTLGLLPRDTAGTVDWMAALRQGVIRPRRSVGDESHGEATSFRFDFLLKGPARAFDALFPHSAHTEWLACESCHPAIFPYRGDSISMASIYQGQYCGVCHGTVAFPVSTCVRCHGSMPAFEAGQAPLLGDIVLARAGGDTAQAGGFARATFSHWVHRVRYTCSACHPGRFRMAVGSDTLTMEPMRRGETCGACHDGRAAFGLLDCTRCHQPSRP